MITFYYLNNWASLHELGEETIISLFDFSTVNWNSWFKKKYLWVTFAVTLQKKILGYISCISGQPKYLKLVKHKFRCPGIQGVVTIAGLAGQTTQQYANIWIPLYKYKIQTSRSNHCKYLDIHKRLQKLWTYYGLDIVLVNLLKLTLTLILWLLNRTKLWGYGAVVGKKWLCIRSGEEYKTALHPCQRWCLLFL